MQLIIMYACIQYPASGILHTIPCSEILQVVRSYLVSLAGTMVLVCILVSIVVRIRIVLVLHVVRLTFRVRRVHTIVPAAGWYDRKNNSI